MTENLSGPSRSEDAYRQLEELIVMMKLAPGELVSEQQLAEKLNLGRTPVREAVQRLALEHLIEVMPRRGLRIAPIDLRKQFRLLETRQVLEILVARRSAERADRFNKGFFEQLAMQFRGVGSQSYETFLRIDRVFNDAVASACDNEFAVEALQQLHGLSRRFWHYYSGHEQDLAHAAELHAATASAIANGDADAAEQAVRAHIDYIHAFTLAIVKK